MTSYNPFIKTKKSHTNRYKVCLTCKHTQIYHPSSEECIRALTSDRNSPICPCKKFVESILKMSEVYPNYPLRTYCYRCGNILAEKILNPVVCPDCKKKFWEKQKRGMMNNYKMDEKGKE